jgi:hypothetical protein
VSPVSPYLFITANANCTLTFVDVSAELKFPPLPEPE